MVLNLEGTNYRKDLPTIHLYPVRCDTRILLEQVAVPSDAENLILTIFKNEVPNRFDTDGYTKSGLKLQTALPAYHVAQLDYSGFDDEFKWNKGNNEDEIQSLVNLIFDTFNLAQ